MLPLNTLSYSDTPSELLLPISVRFEGSVPFSAFCPTSSSVHASKPDVEALLLFHATAVPHAEGSVPDSALRDSRMMDVVRSSRSCTGSVPLSPSPFSTSALTPPASSALGASSVAGVEALNVGLVSAVYVAAAVIVNGTDATVVLPA